ncbi:hypothetical protein [Nocardia sp. NPDC055050]
MVFDEDRYPGRDTGRTSPSDDRSGRAHSQSGSNATEFAEGVPGMNAAAKSVHQGCNVEEQFMKKYLGVKVKVTYGA